MRRIWVVGLVLIGVVGVTAAIIGAQRGAGGGEPVPVSYNGFDWRGDNRLIGIVAGAAYTNNDLNADTATTLFDLNTLTDQTAVQSPANNGTLAVTGKLGVDASGDAGFDIRSSLRNGVSAANTAMATLKVDGRYRLYRVDLLTGRATHSGAFPRDNQVTDIAIPLDNDN